MAPYTPINYFLFWISACVFASFIGGLLYLLIRERYKGTAARRKHWKSLLHKRRKAISGQPGNTGASCSDDSTTEEWQMSSAQSSTTTTTTTTIPLTTDTKSLDNSVASVAKCS